MTEIEALRKLLRRSYWRVDQPSETPVQYVGVYVLRWGKMAEPTVGFGQWDDEDIDTAIAREAAEAAT